MKAARVAPAHVRDFQRDGYVKRGVFGAADLARLMAAFDRIWQDGTGSSEKLPARQCFFRIADDQRLGRVLRYMQWPSYFDPVLDRFRKDLRILAILEPLLGHDLKQIINQPALEAAGRRHGRIWLPSGYPFPPAAFRVPGAGRELCADGIAIDPHRKENARCHPR